MVVIRRKQPVVVIQTLDTHADAILKRKLLALCNTNNRYTCSCYGNKQTCTSKNYKEGNNN